MYLDVWRSGTFPESKQVRYWLQARTERSTSDSLGNVSWVQKDALQLYRRNVPLLHMSRYVIEHDQYYQAFPHISTASNKHWGETDWVHCQPRIGAFMYRFVMDDGSIQYSYLWLQQIHTCWQHLCVIVQCLPPKHSSLLYLTVLQNQNKKNCSEILSGNFTEKDTFRLRNHVTHFSGPTCSLATSYGYTIWLLQHLPLIIILVKV